MTYRAPINDILLALNHGAGLEAAVKAGHYGDFLECGRRYGRAMGVAALA